MKIKIFSVLVISLFVLAGCRSYNKPYVKFNNQIISNDSFFISKYETYKQNNSIKYWIEYINYFFHADEIYQAEEWKKIQKRIKIVNSEGNILKFLIFVLFFERKDSNDTVGFIKKFNLLHTSDKLSKEIKTLVILIEVFFKENLALSEEKLALEKQLKFFKKNNIELNKKINEISKIERNIQMR